MEKFYTISDAGAVKIGLDGKFTALIPNGCGDGSTVVLIVEKDAPDVGGKFFTSIEGGEINIYDYDGAGGNVIATLRGRYGIYFGNEENPASGCGLVAFKRWSD